MLWGWGDGSAVKGWHKDLSVDLQLPHKKSVQRHVSIILELGGGNGVARASPAVSATAEFQVE